MAQDLSGTQVGMSPQNPINNPRPDSYGGRNVFPQSHLHLTTDRYGEWSPFFWAKCERGDVQNLHTMHNLHTFTMATPMVSNVDMLKSFIKVPMQAIYPRNWEYIMTIPTQGDDVPADTRALFDVSRLVNATYNALRKYLAPSSSSFDVNSGIKALVLFELLTSHGSLFERFNMHLNYKFYVDEYRYESCDYIINRYWSDIVRIFEALEVAFIYPDTTTRVIVSSTPRVDYGMNVQYVNPRRFIELVRRQEIVFDYESYAWDTQSWYVYEESFELVGGYSSDIQSDEPFKYYLNIEPIISYQLACAQFASNDHVDYIYSAALYRDNMQALVYGALNELPTFTYNGVTMLYDVFSCKVFSRLIAYFDDSYSDVVSFFINLFSYVPSLRYGDYFTGGKPRPLAVGEYSAKVVDSSVSAIDVTKSIQMQRLLNRVNMIGRKLGDYLAGIFGGSIPDAPKDVPIFLAHQRFKLDGFEVNNTGSDQLSDNVSNITTTNLRSVKDKFSYEIEIAEPCYIIGMNTYESMRVYSKTMDRFAFHHDRYDDFIPEMQYIGDQAIYGLELDSERGSFAPYAYNLRYMEYKQRYSYASGGFIEQLPSWAMITDNMDGNPASINITPDYIRSCPSEFDRFYKSLNGYSLSHYFHFIVAHDNITAPARKMDYAPEILK